MIFLNFLPLFLFLSSSALHLYVKRCGLHLPKFSKFEMETYGKYFFRNDVNPQCIKSVENGFYSKIKQSDELFPEKVAKFFLAACSRVNLPVICINATLKLMFVEASNTERILKQKCLELVSIARNVTYSNIRRIEWCNSLYSEVIPTFVSMLHNTSSNVICQAKVLWPKECPGSQCKNSLKKNNFPSKVFNQIINCVKCFKRFTPIPRDYFPINNTARPLIVRKNSTCYEQIGTSVLGNLVAMIERTGYYEPNCYGIYPHLKKIVKFLKIRFGEKFDDFVQEDSVEMQHLSRRRKNALFRAIKCYQNTNSDCQVLERSIKEARMLVTNTFRHLNYTTNSEFCSCKGLNIKVRKLLCIY